MLNHSDTGYRNDIHLNTNSGKTYFPVLFDLSLVSDPVYHKILNEW